MPVGSRDLVGPHDGRDDGHIGDLEEHGEGTDDRHDEVDQPDRRREQPDQRDDRVEQTAGPVADHQQPPTVEPVRDHPREDTRDDRRDTREAGDDPHLDHRTRAVQHQERDRHVREGVPEGGQGLDDKEHTVGGVSPERGGTTFTRCRRRLLLRPFTCTHCMPSPVRSASTVCVPVRRGPSFSGRPGDIVHERTRAVLRTGPPASYGGGPPSTAFLGDSVAHADQRP